MLFCYLADMQSSTTITTPILSGNAFDALPESIRSHIRCLEATLQSLYVRIHELEARLAKNSSNSSKPPGSDGLKKPKTKSQREKSGKKPGGQQGHIGKGLLPREIPDVIVVHAPVSCSGCGSSLNEADGSCAERRQVFEIPRPVIEVTEHRVLEKTCPCCGEVTRAGFPENVKGPVQYGNRVQALVAYFAHQHFVPVDRVCQIFEDVFDLKLSPGTCANVDEKLFQQLESFESGLKTYLLAARVLNFDETGMRCEKKLHWVHVTSSQMATLYAIHAKRGQEAMDEIDILPKFQGIAIHDHWAPYFSYQQLTHGLCNAHHLRELTFIHEEEKEPWAKLMKDLLIIAKEEVEKYREQGALPKVTLEQIEQGYEQIITSGLAYHEQLIPLPKGKRGKQKQRDGKNLLDRLDKKRACVLLFMYDFSVDFTNNQGERDIRMVKLKQKVGGCFRTSKGGRVFCRIRSYISTARKQSWNIWDALMDAINGSPKLLAIDQMAALQQVAV